MSVWATVAVRNHIFLILTLISIVGPVTACAGGNAIPPASDTSILSTWSATPKASSTTPHANPPAASRGYPTTGPNLRRGEAPPVLPHEASRNSDLGAALFAAYYYRSFDWALATNDPYPIRGVADPTCGACTRAIDQIDRLKQSGDVLRGGRIEVRSSGVVRGSFTVHADVVVKVSVVQEPETRQHPGSPAKSVTGATQDTSFVFLNWTILGWRVVEVMAA